MTEEAPLVVTPSMRRESVYENFHTCSAEMTISNC